MESLIAVALLSACSFTASRAASPEPDTATYDDSVGLDQELSASGSYTLTKVECTTLRSLISKLTTSAPTEPPESSRAPRSADVPREDMSGMVRDSILARIDQGEECCAGPVVAVVCVAKLYKIATYKMNTVL